MSINNILAEIFLLFSYLNFIATIFADLDACGKLFLSLIAICFSRAIRRAGHGV